MAAPHINLSTSFQDMSGLGANRRFTLKTTDKNCVVALECAASTGDTTGVRIETLEFSKPTLQLVDGSANVRYQVLSGSVTGAVWADADAAPIVGPKGDSNGVTFEKVVDANAAATTALKRFYRAPGARTVTGVRFIPEASLTADNTNFKTITVSRCSAVDGTVDATAASLTTEITGSGNWTAGVPVTLTLGAGVSLTAGQMIGFAITKTGTGVVIPAGTFQIDF
jgi:hypothetical protein